MSFTYTCINNRKGRPSRLLEARYNQIATRVDALAVDQVFRVAHDESPSPKWYSCRAKLNRFVLSLKSIDGVYVVLRLK